MLVQAATFEGCSRLAGDRQNRKTRVTPTIKQHTRLSAYRFPVSVETVLEDSEYRSMTLAFRLPVSCRLAASVRALKDANEAAQV